MLLKCVVATIIKSRSRLFLSELTEPEAVREDTPRKLALLQGIRFEEPTQAGKRVYDDSKFVQSLSEQVTMGKG